MPLPRLGPGGWCPRSPLGGILGLGLPLGAPFTVSGRASCVPCSAQGLWPWIQGAALFPKREIEAAVFGLCDCLPPSPKSPFPFSTLNPRPCCPLVPGLIHEPTLCDLRGPVLFCVVQFSHQHTGPHSTLSSLAKNHIRYCTILCTFCLYWS